MQRMSEGEMQVRVRMRKVEGKAEQRMSKPEIVEKTPYPRE